MTEFESESSGVRSNRSVICATTLPLMEHSLHFRSRTVIPNSNLIDRALKQAFTSTYFKVRLLKSKSNKDYLQNIISMHN